MLLRCELPCRVHPTEMHRRQPRPLSPGSKPLSPAGEQRIIPLIALEQGQDTDPDAVAEIRDAVRNGSEASVRLLNYKKSGKPFWNMFTLAPMADVDGNLRFIIGVQVHSDYRRRIQIRHTLSTDAGLSLTTPENTPHRWSAAATETHAIQERSVHQSRSPSKVAEIYLLTLHTCSAIQVDVTAAEAAPGKIPAVNAAAAGQVKQAAGMINTALQHMGLGPDPWKAITVGVMPAKPHTAVRQPLLTVHPLHHLLGNLHCCPLHSLMLRLLCSLHICLAVCQIFC